MPGPRLMQKLDRLLLEVPACFQRLKLLSKWEVGVIVAFCLLLLSLNGFCFSRLRFLSNEELFTSAISAEASRMAESELANSSPTNFLQKHPGCCSFAEDWITGLSGYHALYGSKVYVVRIVYRLSDQEIARLPREGTFYEAYVEVSCCGKALNSIGQRLKALSETSAIGSVQ